ncbi:hypothetical protein [Rhizobium paknamense]|uniref:Uncharacterized protein n=1 Tax=Rhizobium paknamense TaxID=1206817 RepID=A0ABU0IHV3_9HYPH|nr:hypothetical protein [Rhizobium paknamense]MDQ0457252.1 hypothetical protein [Rhizobium paknamense]
MNLANLVGSTIETIEMGKAGTRLVFSNGYELSVRTPVLFGCESVERYIGDIALSVNHSSTGLTLRFLRNWPIVIDLEQAKPRSDTTFIFSKTARAA